MTLLSKKEMIMVQINLNHWHSTCSSEGPCCDDYGTDLTVNGVPLGEDIDNLDYPELFKFIFDTIGIKYNLTETTNG